jgi:hypothetical protein
MNQNLLHYHLWTYSSQIICGPTLKRCKNIYIEQSVYHCLGSINHIYVAPEASKMNPHSQKNGRYQNTDPIEGE